MIHTKYSTIKDFKFISYTECICDYCGKLIFKFDAAHFNPNDPQEKKDIYVIASKGNAPLYSEILEQEFCSDLCLLDYLNNKSDFITGNGKIRYIRKASVNVINEITAVEVPIPSIAYI